MAAAAILKKLKTDWCLWGVINSVIYQAILEQSERNVSYDNVGLNYVTPCVAGIIEIKNDVMHSLADMTSSQHVTS